LHALKGYSEGWRAVGKLDEDMCEYHLDQDEKVIKCRRKSKDERPQPNPQRKYGTPLEQVSQIPDILPIVNVVFINFNIPWHMLSHLRRTYQLDPVPLQPRTYFPVVERVSDQLILNVVLSQWQEGSVLPVSHNLFPFHGQVLVELNQTLKFTEIFHSFLGLLLRCRCDLRIID
jgi:hypothetical protein